MKENLVQEKGVFYDSGCILGVCRIWSQVLVVAAPNFKCQFLTHFSYNYVSHIHILLGAGERGRLGFLSGGEGGC